MSKRKQGSGAGDNASNHPADEMKQRHNFTAQPEQLALFAAEDAPYIRPATPNPGTKAHFLLTYLLTGASLTQIEWLAMGFGWRLAAEVQALKDLGWCVESVMVRRVTCENKIAQYWLNGEQLRQHLAEHCEVTHV